MCNLWTIVLRGAVITAHIQLKERKLSYPHYTTVLNLKDIEFPMTLNQIKMFENLNDIYINCIEKKKELSILPIRLTERKMDIHVNLLYIQNNTTFRMDKKSVSPRQARNSAEKNTRNSFAIGM